jgi:DNA-binding response OmpR family regulator
LRRRRKPSVMKGSEKFHGERIRLLLVDDEEGYVKVLAKRMTRRNMEVMTALSGSEGIQRLRKQDFDVAILDLKMEDMDGIEVLRVFKKMVPDMPVIMLTGHGTEKAAREGLEVGAFDYLMKPCDLEELVEKIRAACRR